MSVPGEVYGENGRGPRWSTLWHLEAGTRCAYGGRIDFFKIVLSEKPKPEKENNTVHNVKQ